MTEYKPLFFDDSVSPKSVEELVSKINKDEKYYLFFSSKGGESAAAEYLVNFLNFHKDNIIIFTGNYLLSSGFEICYNFKGKVIVGDNSFGMVHLVSRQVELNSLLDKRSLDYIDFSDINELNKKLFKTYSNFLTKQELKNLKKGDEIGLSNSRLKEILTKERQV